MGLFTATIKLLLYYLGLLIITSVLVPDYLAFLMLPFLYVFVLPMQILINLIIDFVNWLQSIPYLSPYITKMDHIDLLTMIKDGTIEWARQNFASVFIFALPLPIRLVLWLLMGAIYSWFYFSTITKIID